MLFSTFLIPLQGMDSDSDPHHMGTPQLLPPALLRNMLADQYPDVVHHTNMPALCVLPRGEGVKMGRRSCRVGWITP